MAKNIYTKKIGLKRFIFDLKLKFLTFQFY